jgi:hypothetical protein
MIAPVLARQLRASRRPGAFPSHFTQMGTPAGCAQNNALTGVQFPDQPAIEGGAWGAVFMPYSQSSVQSAADGTGKFRARVMARVAVYGSDSTASPSMNSPEYDAREVLQKFIATLDVSADAVIRDAADLAHPKEVIKSVLQHCIKTIEGADERTFLRTAYRSLGSYQDLTDDERKALSALRQVGPPAPPESKLQEEQARQIREFAIPLQAVTDRLKSETAILAQELKLLPGED